MCEPVEKSKEIQSQSTNEVSEMLQIVVWKSCRTSEIVNMKIIIFILIVFYPHNK